MREAKTGSLWGPQGTGVCSNLGLDCFCNPCKQNPLPLVQLWQVYGHGFRGWSSPRGTLWLPRAVASFELIVWTLIGPFS